MISRLDHPLKLGGIDIIFRAPTGKVDPNEQTRMVEDAITEQADAILLSPSDGSALAPVVDRAIDAKIPVVIIDSGIETEGITGDKKIDTGVTVVIKENLDKIK